MIKLLVFILAVVAEVFAIKVYTVRKSKLILGVICIQAVNVIWNFGRVLGLVP